jgi:hypothetical protein
MRRGGCGSIHEPRGDDRIMLERLTPLDLSNLRIESHGLPMNVAALVFLDAGALPDASAALTAESVRTRIEQRLHLGPSASATAPPARFRPRRPGVGR